jgi:hypothetical protein
VFLNRWGSVAMDALRKISSHAFTLIVLFLAVSSDFADSLDSLLVTSLAINRNVVFAATSDCKLAWSADTGKTWSIQAVGLCPADVPPWARKIYDIKILCDTVYIATYCGIFRSATAALDWKEISTGITDLRITGLHVCNGNLFAGGYDGAYRFSFTSATWKKLLVDSAIVNVRGNFPCSAITHTASTLVIAYNSRLYSSADYGDSWKNISNAVVVVPDSVKAKIGTFYDTLRFIDYLGASNTTITAANFDGSVFVSRDLGASWTLTRPGCPICDMITMPGFFSDSTGSYAGTRDHIEVSHDNGAHWLTTDTLHPGATVFARLGDLMAVGTTQGVFFSRDEFQTMSRSNVPAIANSPRSLDMQTSQRVVEMEQFDLRGRRLTKYNTFLPLGRYSASGMFITKLRFETGRWATTVPSAQLKSSCTCAKQRF